MKVKRGETVQYCRNRHGRICVRVTRVAKMAAPDSTVGTWHLHLLYLCYLRRVDSLDLPVQDCANAFRGCVSPLGGGSYLPSKLRFEPFDQLTQSTWPG